jgi:aldose sugar dehydrogenase
MSLLTVDASTPNSGWHIFVDPISQSGNTEDEIVSFTNSHYTDPLLTWPGPIAVTDIEFLESSS